MYVMGIHLHAQVSYSGGIYSENFDSLGSGGITWTDNTTVPGWYARKSITTYSGQQPGRHLRTSDPDAHAFVPVSGPALNVAVCHIEESKITVYGARHPEKLEQMTGR
jgi:hypothetical protein